MKDAVFSRNTRKNSRACYSSFHPHLRLLGSLWPSAIEIISNLTNAIPAPNKKLSLCLEPRPISPCTGNRRQYSVNDVVLMVSDIFQQKRHVIIVQREALVHQLPARKRHGRCKSSFVYGNLGHSHSREGESIVKPPLTLSESGSRVTSRQRMVAPEQRGCETSGSSGTTTTLQARTFTTHPRPHDVEIGVSS